MSPAWSPKKIWSMASQICSSELRLLGGTARLAFKSSLIHSLKEGLARERARDSGGSDRVVLGGDESDVPRLGRLAVPDEQPEQRAPVASGLVLHLLAECLVLDGTKQDAAELGILLLDDERLVDEAGRDGIHRE